MTTNPDSRVLALALAVTLAWVALLALVGWPVPAAVGGDAVVEVAHGA